MNLVKKNLWGYSFFSIIRFKCMNLFNNLRLNNFHLILNLSSKMTYSIFLNSKSRIIIFTLTFQFFSNQIIAQDNAIFKRKREKVDVSNLELRLRLTDFFIRYAESVEVSADRIFYDTSDPDIKKAALMWKIYGISAMNKAIHMPDPIASFFNAWPLSKQLIHFFETGKGMEELGPYHEDVAKLCYQLETNLDSIIINIGDEERFIKFEPDVQEWADQHPIENFYFSRESTMPLFAKWIGEGNYGIGKNVATITEEVIELSNKLNLYVDLIPRQARWQVDYAILNYLQDSTLSMDLSTLISSMDRITKVFEMTPEIIEYNREATMRDFDEQREKSLQLLINERKAVIEEIRKERIEVISKIITERMTVLEELKNERAIVLEEIRDISNNVVRQTGNEVERIANLVFWRLTIISIILGITIIIAVVLYKKL